LNPAEARIGQPRRRYLFETIAVYLILLVILVTLTAIILVLPYENTFIGGSGADNIYLDAFIYMAAASTVILILGLFYNVMVWMEGTLGNADADISRSRKLLISLKILLRSIFSRNFGRGLKIFIVETILMRKFWRTSRIRWFFHALILFGFIGIFVLDIITSIALEILDASCFKEQTGWGKLWIRDFGFDLLGLMLLIGLLAAASRRFVSRPKQLVTGAEDILSVVLLLAVVLSGFVVEGIGISTEIPGHEEINAYAFMGVLFASFLPAVTVTTYAQIWMIHAVISLALIIYIPFSKLFHIFAAPLAMQLNEVIRGKVNGPVR